MVFYAFFAIGCFWLCGVKVVGVSRVVVVDCVIFCVVVFEGYRGISVPLFIYKLCYVQFLYVFD